MDITKMGKRRVCQLRWARAIPRPEGIPVGRPRGIKALGIRYEKALAGVLPGVSGQWFEFEDRNGLGVCQVDFLAKVDQALVVFEAKHTWTEVAHEELETLYLPVVEAGLRKHPLGLVVAKRLVLEMGRVKTTGNLEEAVGLAALGHRVAWHWIGGRISLPREERAEASHNLALARELALA
jgi:hypothetical protein